MAMRAEAGQDHDSARKLLKAATEHETGLYAKLAAERYLRSLAAQADGPGMLLFVTSEGSKHLSPWVRATAQAEALAMTGRHPQALVAWARLRADYPGEAAENETTIRTGMVLSAIKAGTPEANRILADEFRGLLEMTGTTAWYKATAGILQSIQEQPGAMGILEEHELQLAQARILSGTRDYGASVLAFRRYYALVFPSSGTGRLEPSALPATGNAQPEANTQEAPSARNVSTPGRLGAVDGALLASTLSRPALSDLARAFLFGSRSEGEAIFALLASQAAQMTREPKLSEEVLDGAVERTSQTAYLYLFWAGRFARGAERWPEAASLFSTAAELAQDPADLDAALWYEAEARSKYSSTDAVAVLAKAYGFTANPAYYSDLLAPLSRKALADRSGTLLAAIIAAAAPAGNIPSGATPRDRARLDYLGARAVATGIISAGQLQTAGLLAKEGTTDAYIMAALNRAYRQDVDPWYRLLSAYRLGLPLVEPADGPGAPQPPPGPVTADSGQPPLEQLAPELTNQTEQEEKESIPDPEVLGEADTLAMGMIRFGLASRVRTELGAVFRELEPSTIRAVAEALMEAGDYGTAIRAIAPLFSRAGYVPTRRDRELYWPQAYLAEIRVAAARFRLSEALLLGLVRSESLFQPAVVSSAGAVGLAQLMPATTAETAGRLRMAEYDVTNPQDNLTLGASYFRRILDNQNGRFMPALFSYNAGSTRFRRWEKQYGPLPQDLLLEVLDYAETRQYGRNVVAAAMAYAALYYEDNLHGFLASLLGE